MTNDPSSTASRGGPQRRSTRPVRLGGRSLFSAMTALIAVTVLTLVIYPLLRMSSRGVGGGWEAWRDLAQSPWMGTMLRDTGFVIIVSTVLSLVLAAVLAWINERTDASIGALGDALPLIPLFLPSVALAIGWVMLANPTVGFLNGAIDATLGRLGLGFSLNIYSYAGLIFVYVLTILPFAYLPIVAAFRTLDPALEEAARVSGAGAFKVFTSVSLRSIAPAMLAGLVLVSIVAFGLFSVPVIIGVRPEIDILSVRIIQSIRGTFPPDYGVAARLSTILLVVLAALWWTQGRIIKGGRFAKVGQRTSGGHLTKLGRWRWPLRSLLFLYIVLAAVLPTAALIVVSFQTYWQPDILSSSWTWHHYENVLFGAAGGQRAIYNSLGFGTVAGAATVLVGALLMVYAHRVRNRLGRVADAVAKVPAAVPNTVMAVAFILALGGPPLGLGGTFMILFLGYVIVYLPYASLASEASVAQVDRSLEEASALSGARESRTFTRIVLPLITPGLFAAWALVFVGILGDLALAVLLSTGRTAVIGYVLFDVWEQGTFGGVAVLALLMTALTIPIVLVMLWLGKPRWKRKTVSRHGTRAIQAHVEHAREAGRTQSARRDRTRLAPLGTGPGIDRTDGASE